MNNRLVIAQRSRGKLVFAGWACVLLLTFGLGAARASTDVGANGPWNVRVMAGSVGFKHALPAQTRAIAAKADWSAYAWIKPRQVPHGKQLLAGFGAPTGAARYFMLSDGHLGLWWGHGQATMSHAALHAGQWQFVAAVVHQGRLHLFLDGRQVATARADQTAVPAELGVGPLQQPWPKAVHFGGHVAAFTVQAGALSDAAIKQMAGHPPSATLTTYRLAGGHWPVQTHAIAGQVVPQPPATLPHSRAPFSKPQAHRPGPHPALAPQGADTWVLGDWQLASATALPQAKGSRLSQPAYNAAAKPWMQATVPGTVLTTLVDRGVYPNPAYGLNNTDIPESLNKHDWWYHTRFKLPANLAGRQLHLIFGGIDYAAEVWVNGKRLGKIRGAFVRGRFNVTRWLHPGRVNAIAVRIAPPPNPGVPHVESLVAGPGLNGGMEALDGPTFIATEGWDWMPAVRDRNSGLWQPVTLHATGAVHLGDPRVVTHLPLPDLTRAAVDIDVPLKNPGTQAVTGTLHAAFGKVRVSRQVTVPPGGTVVHLTPANQPQLEVHHPRLWWPNGYGKANLYRLKLSFGTDGQVSDTRSLQFGIRQVSYELSLFDADGQLQRVLITPEAKRHHAVRLLDVDYRAIHKTHVPHVWAYSMRPAAAHSPAVKKLPRGTLSPYLVIRVNGVRIAARGGSWGMDDFMKRVSRKHLQPYFELQKKAHLNIIRNWVGQNTEPEFYRLADKYGMLVINEFWQSTQNDNLEPMDDALFMRNAADVIRRYRNHPSVILWFGRNEGVPQPHLNQRLATVINRLDGTRLYMPSSNRINLWTSGPYSYRPPQDYFTKLAQGFAVEVGIPSFPTLGAFKAMMPKADQWPISDDWAYHGWHQKGNGDVHGFMRAMRTRFGKPTSLRDFERKVQMMNLVNYRAIFEGFNAHLWTRDSGRMLWMTQPAWPDTTWQIYSHDYDTQASYYGVMAANQPVHVQMNLPNRHLAVVNNREHAIDGAHVEAHVYGLSGKLLKTYTCAVDAPATSTTRVCANAELDKLVKAHQVVFVSLRLASADGEVLSRNFYWTAAKPGDLHQLDQLPKVALQLSAQREGSRRLTVHLANPTDQVALNAKLTLVDAAGHRILPAYYSDNYVSLAPGASRTITITVRDGTRLAGAKVKLWGWNEAAKSAGVAAQSRRASSMR